MTLLFKSIKLLGWILTGIITLIVTIFIGLIFINWSDEAPTEPALTLMRYIEPNLSQTSNQRVSDNAYLFYIEQATQPQYQLTPELHTVVQACNSKDCSELLATERSQLPFLIAEHKALLDLYQQLRTIGVWHEILPASANELPPYQPLLQAQSVFLLEAWLAAQQNDLVLSQQMLDADLNFWRLLLKSNRLLFSKSISAAAVRRHFDYASLIRQSLTIEQRLHFTATSWQKPFSEAELSMYAAFAGEWHFANQLVEQMWQQDEAEQTQPWYNQWAIALLQPMFKKQASKNDLAVMMLRCSDGMTSPSLPWHSWFYNPVGKLLNRVGVSRYCVQYTEKLQQLEVSRLQLLE